MTRFTEAELKARRARGESRTDLARLRLKSEAELEADIATDEDFRDVPEDWYINAEAAGPVTDKR